MTNNVESHYAFVSDTGICLDKLYGIEVWKMPPLECSRIKFTEVAQEHVADVISMWEGGINLDKLYPTLTLDDLLPSPSTNMVKAKRG